MDIWISSSVGTALDWVYCEMPEDVETEALIEDAPIQAKDASASVLGLTF